MPLSPKFEANQYDKIFKENIEVSVIPMLEKFLGIKFQIIERLTEKLQTTTEREADFLARIIDDESKESILHLEYQTRSEDDLIFRLGEYHGIIQRKYKLPILHLVVYLGSEPFRHKTRMEPSNIYSGFNLVSFNELDHTRLLSSNIPEEVILAILADFGKREPDIVFKYIFRKLKYLANDEAALRKYIAQLGVFSRLRKLSTEFKETKNMLPILIDYDPTEDAYYIDGKEDERLRFVKNLKKMGFSIEKMAEAIGISVSEVQQYLNRLDP
ncbi:MAG: hypothetical protein AB8F95_02820 [Bacteroidia bacterium]